MLDEIPDPRGEIIQTLDPIELHGRLPGERLIDPGPLRRRREPIAVPAPEREPLRLGGKEPRHKGLPVILPGDLLRRDTRIQLQDLVVPSRIERSIMGIAKEMLELDLGDWQPVHEHPGFYLDHGKTGGILAHLEFHSHSLLLVQTAGASGAGSLVSAGGIPTPSRTSPPNLRSRTRAI